MCSVAECPPASKSTAVKLVRVLQVLRRAKRAFEALKRFDTGGSNWLLFHTIEKLDSATKLQWQTTQADGKQIPKWDDLFSFFDLRVQAFTVAFSSPINSNRSLAQVGNFVVKNSNTRRHCAVTQNPSGSSKEISNASCPFCSKSHFIGFCYKFMFKLFTARSFCGKMLIAS